MPLQRDEEGDAVRRAEETAIEVVPLRRFGRFAEIERYVEQVMTSVWWDQHFPDAPIEATVVRRSRTATFSAATTTDEDVGVVALVDGHGWGMETVLHELAHLAAGISAGHGRHFRAALLQLWRHEAGVEAWAALSRQLTEQL